MFYQYIHLTRVAQEKKIPFIKIAKFISSKVQHFANSSPLHVRCVPQTHAQNKYTMHVRVKSHGA
jgi:hypothetical protein